MTSDQTKIPSPMQPIQTQQAQDSLQNELKLRYKFYDNPLLLSSKFHSTTNEVILKVKQEEQPPLTDLQLANLEQLVVCGPQMEKLKQIRNAPLRKNPKLKGQSHFHSTQQLNAQASELTFNPYQNINLANNSSIVINPNNASTISKLQFSDL